MGVLRNGPLVTGTHTPWWWKRMQSSAFELVSPVVKRPKRKSNIFSSKATNIQCLAYHRQPKYHDCNPLNPIINMAILLAVPFDDQQLPKETSWH